MLRGICRSSSPQGTDTVSVQVNFGIDIKNRLLPRYQLAYDQTLQALGDAGDRVDEQQDVHTALSVRIEIRTAIWNSKEPQTEEWYELREEVIDLLTQLSRETAKLAAYRRESAMALTAFEKASAALNRIQAYEDAPVFVAEKPHELEEFYAGEECFVYFENDRPDRRIFASKFESGHDLGQFADFQNLSAEQAYYFRALQPMQEKFNPVCRIGTILSPVAGQTIIDYTEAMVQMEPEVSSVRGDLGITKTPVIRARSHGPNLNGLAIGERVVVVLDPDFKSSARGTIITYKDPTFFVRDEPYHNGLTLQTFGFSYQSHNFSPFAKEPFLETVNPVISEVTSSRNEVFSTTTNASSAYPQSLREYNGQTYDFYGNSAGGFFGTQSVNFSAYVAAQYVGVDILGFSWRPNPPQAWTDFHELAGATPYLYKYNDTTDIDEATLILKGTPYGVSGDIHNKLAWGYCVSLGYERAYIDPADTTPAFLFPIYEHYHYTGSTVSARITPRFRKPNWRFTGVTVRVFRYKLQGLTPTFIGPVFTGYVPDYWREREPAQVYGPLIAGWPDTTGSHTLGAVRASMQMANGDVV